VIWSAFLAPDGTLIYKRRHSLPESVDSDDLPSSTGTPQSATGQQNCLQLLLLWGRIWEIFYAISVAYLATGSTYMDVRHSWLPAWRSSTVFLIPFKSRT